jgi:hypothetical protein
MKRNHALIFEYDEHMKALENGVAFVPCLTANDVPKKPEVNGKKRKSSIGDREESPKRKRIEKDEDAEMGSAVDSGSELDSLDSESESDSDSDSSSDNTDSDEDESNASGLDDSSESASDSDDDDSTTDTDQEGKVTVEDLKAKKEEVALALKNAQDLLAGAEKDKKDADDALSALKDTQVKAQREKNAFCSLKRSEVSHPVNWSDTHLDLTVLYVCSFLVTYSRRISVLV